MTKTIAVIGATGAQGGGLVRAILADSTGEFAVRAVARDPQSAKALELAAAGAEVVAGDLDDEESLRKAFDGVYGAFVVTNYFAQRTEAEVAARSAADMELEQAGNAARAARDAGVEHVIWSTLVDTRPHFGDTDRVPTLDDGRYKVPHFDAKSEADELFRQSGVPTTFLQTTLFYENLTSDLGPVRDENNRLVLTLPMDDAPLNAIAVGDIGLTALGIFRRTDEYTGRTIAIGGDKLTGQQIVDVMSDVLGEPVTYAPHGWDDFRSFGFPGAVEFGNMFQFYAENHRQFSDARDLDEIRTLNPQLQTFRQWFEQHQSEIAR
ncbi:NmrA/HSCARG family protein [Kribbella sp. NPDC051770]|uniref:NmrA/HSCARG family protein n=1 Tax=Kribbella sp. NPDC051770 TaxID=3155413 RepID=UPI00342B2EBC